MGNQNFLVHSPQMDQKIGDRGMWAEVMVVWGKQTKALRDKLV